ncbi:MAG: hypothetical protein ACYDHZ_06465 [Dehalococcoidia bacterium]
MRWSKTLRKIIFVLLVICFSLTGCIIVYTDKPAQNENKTADKPAGSDTGTIYTQDLPVQSQLEQTATLNMVSGESGSLVKSAATYMKSNLACAGDTDANFASRAFLSFDITPLPKSAVINEATLDSDNYAVIGSPTYGKSNWGNMGALEFYQVRYGSSGDIARIDYESTAPLVSSIKLTDLTGTPLKVNVTQDNNGNNFIQQLLDSGAARCQFRVQFFTSTNWDSKPDLMCLDGMVLRIKYSLPK